MGDKKNENEIITFANVVGKVLYFRYVNISIHTDFLHLVDLFLGICGSSNVILRHVL